MNVFALAVGILTVITTASSATSFEGFLQRNGVTASTASRARLLVHVLAGLIAAIVAAYVVISIA